MPDIDRQNPNNSVINVFFHLSRTLNTYMSGSNQRTFSCKWPNKIISYKGKHISHIDNRYFSKFFL